MAGINIEEQKVVHITASDGTPISRGDMLLLRAGDEDVLCRFVEVNNGYFVTETIDKGACQKQNKYRLGTIKKSMVVEDIRFRAKEDK